MCNVSHHYSIMSWFQHWTPTVSAQTWRHYVKALLHRRSCETRRAQLHYNTPASVSSVTVCCQAVAALHTDIDRHRACFHWEPNGGTFPSSDLSPRGLYIHNGTNCTLNRLCQNVCYTFLSEELTVYDRLYVESICDLDGVGLRQPAWYFLLHADINLWYWCSSEPRAHRAAQKVDRETPVTRTHFTNGSFHRDRMSRHAATRLLSGNRAQIYFTNTPEMFTILICFCSDASLFVVILIIYSLWHQRTALLHILCVCHCFISNDRNSY